MRAKKYEKFLLQKLKNAPLNYQASPNHICKSNIKQIKQYT